MLKKTMILKSEPKHDDRENIEREREGGGGGGGMDGWMDGWMVYCIISELTITVLWVSST